MIPTWSEQMRTQMGVTIDDVKMRFGFDFLTV